jgi:hypothetical protein
MEQNATAHPVSFLTSRYKQIAYATADGDLAIVSMVTYTTHVLARMSVLWVVLFQEDSAYSLAQHSVAKNSRWEKSWS